MSKFLPWDMFSDRSHEYIVMVYRGLTAIFPIGLTVLAIMVYIIRATLRRRHMAPGPSGLPLLGNLLQQPSSLQFIKYTEWAQEYGTCIYPDFAPPSSDVIKRFHFFNRPYWSARLGLEQPQGCHGPTGYVHCKPLSLHHCSLAGA